ncbi:MAG: T9SS type A sorting domain-containing protein, partial [Candidatus Cloacimonetes bacterium]|nr:T9SS type A sorting domain-containing protein [Candidatus Cloacimonadota bacterium]
GKMNLLFAHSAMIRVQKITLIVLLLLLASPVYASVWFTINSESQTISRIDLSTQSVDNSFALLGQYPDAAPNKMAISNDTVYAVITYENSIQVIDANTGVTGQYIYIEDSATPSDILVVGDLAYVSGGGTNRVYKIDLVTGTVIGWLPVGTMPEGLIIWNDQLFVCNTGFNLSNYTYDPGTLTVINLNNFTITNTVFTGLNPRSGVVFNNQLHIACSGDYGATPGEISVIDSATLTVCATIASGGTPASISADPNGFIYCGHSWPAGITVYDAATYAIVSSPADNLYLGGNALAVGDGFLASVDAGDYIQASTLYFYATGVTPMFQSFSIGVGTTDVKMLPETVAVADIPFAPGFNLTIAPNPFNPCTTIRFTADEPGKAFLKVYNTRGQLVRSSNENISRAGTHSIAFNGDNLGSGVYFFQLKLNDKITTKKAILMK